MLVDLQNKRKKAVYLANDEIGEITWAMFKPNVL